MTGDSERSITSEGLAVTLAVTTGGSAMTLPGVSTTLDKSTNAGLFGDDHDGRGKRLRVQEKADEINADRRGTVSRAGVHSTASCRIS